MFEYNLAASCSFGVESVLKRELFSLGFEKTKAENGRVIFRGTGADIARCSINLRTAERVYIVLAEFPALDFEELYQGALAVPWADILPKNAFMHVIGKSVKSKLRSVPDCQSIVKKAVVDAMSARHGVQQFPEDGAEYKIEISLLNDLATVSLDTSGKGLHRRGYREAGGDAPLRETLAAAVILLSRWNPERLFCDPLCGSGTIPIEAAMIGADIAPGLKRGFSAESWGLIDQKMWETAREEAEGKIRRFETSIMASDIEWKQFKKARENAERAGVADLIVFQKKPVSEFSSSKKFGCIVTNPPYGERLGDKRDAENVYREMGAAFSGLDEWSYFVLTAHPEFEKHFRRKSDKNRKLYNGKIKTYLYQYLGELPPRRV